MLSILNSRLCTDGTKKVKKNGQKKKVDSNPELLTHEASRAQKKTETPEEVKACKNIFLARKYCTWTTKHEKNRGQKTE